MHAILNAARRGNSPKEAESAELAGSTLPSVRRVCEPQVLRPFHSAEAISIHEAALIARRAPRTLREWCHLHDIGRRVAGQWRVSRVALQMFLDDNTAALASYHARGASSPT